MIRFKRGKTSNWLKLKKPLADGQPGYDRDKHKIKIGNGKDVWADLPYAGGLSSEEVLNSELLAKIRHKLDPENTTIITYGTALPDKDTVGQLYLQYYETEPEVDYVVSSGVNKAWSYRKWKSGRAECWCNIPISAEVQTEIESTTLYSDTTISRITYPFEFKTTPIETATLQSPGGIAWLASRGSNSKGESALYCIISPDKQISADYKISLFVSGFWK